MAKKGCSDLMTGRELQNALMHNCNRGCWKKRRTEVPLQKHKMAAQAMMLRRRMLDVSLADELKVSMSSSQGGSQCGWRPGRDVALTGMDDVLLDGLFIASSDASEVDGVDRRDGGRCQGRTLRNALQTL